VNESERPFASIIDLRELIRSREVSPVEVTRQMLDRIKKVTPYNELDLSLMAEEAIEAAQLAEKKVMAGDLDNSPLLGIPFAITDSLHLKGQRITLGAKEIEGEIDSYDSIEVARIKKAGGIILGKTNLAEFDLGDSILNCRNPWNYSKGMGSSCAASAVAGGFASVALGTDLCGATRLSAALCGVVGVKPTRGAYPKFKRKHVPYSQKHFSSRSPITHTVEDAALVLEVIADYGIDLEEMTEHEPKRIAVSEDFGFIPISSEVSRATDQTVKLLQELGHTVERVDLGLDRDLLIHFRNLIAADHYAPLAHLHAQQPITFTPKTMQWLAMGDEVTGVQYSLALSYAGWLRCKFDELFQTYDLLLVPTQADPACSLDDQQAGMGETELDALVGQWALTLPFNMSGHPAVQIPVGFSESGTPIGMQLAGGYFKEPVLFNAAHSMQEVLQWEKWRPGS
jgi:Asp-tRNA(Asn)/Glu-tRNA(Gln) amidotransferase A subunit family amidase